MVFLVEAGFTMMFRIDNAIIGIQGNYRDGRHSAPSARKDSQMTTMTISDPRPNIEVRPQRIAGFLRGQAHLKHLLVVWHDGREVVFQALPDPDAAFEILRESLRQRPLAPDLARNPTSSVPVCFRRLENQIQACIRGLRKAGLEFVLCFKIDDQAARIAYEVHPSRHSVGTDVVALLEQAKRSRCESAGIVADWRP